MDVLSLCRVCMCNRGGVGGVWFPLLEGEGERFPSFPLSDKMMDCARVFISREDMLPKEICGVCADRLNAAYDFKVQCEKSYHRLIHLVKGKIFDVKIEQTETVCIKEEVGECYVEYPAVTDITKTQQLSETEDNGDNKKINRRLNTRGKNISLKDDQMSEVPLDDGLADGDESVGEADNSLLVEIRSEPGVPDLLTEQNSTCKSKGKTRKGRKPKAERKRKYVRLRLVCHHCGQTFASQNSLKGHERRHRGEKVYMCSTCGKSFFILGELKKHSNIHKTVKPYLCKYCERRFADWSSRLKHERCHRGERPYGCDVCGKSFAYSYVLTRHKLTHTGAKLFSCEKCHKCFAVKYQLKSHMSNEHKDVKETEKDCNVENLTVEVPVVPSVDDTSQTRPKKQQTGVKKKVVYETL